MKRELQPVTDRWKHIGLALRLDPSELKVIERENRDLEDCLTEALALWLRKAYNTERFGEPSWELLARAVGDPAGGNNPALAEKIGKKHGGIAIMKEEWMSLQCMVCVPCAVGSRGIQRVQRNSSFLKQCMAD